MDDFLVNGAKSTFECTSIEDFKLQFGTLRETKVGDTKAEHITAIFEFRPTAIFYVPENESDAAEPNPNDSPAPVANEVVAATTRTIRAHETLMNQPADDPALQKLVAKHVITSLGVVDGSTWTVRSISRTASGWTFQYLCKSSTQAWARQNAKQNAKTLVGESSGKDGWDPVNLGKATRAWEYLGGEPCLTDRLPSSPCVRLPRVDHYRVCQEQPKDYRQAGTYPFSQNRGRTGRTVQPSTTTCARKTEQKEKGPSRSRTRGW